MLCEDPDGWGREVPEGGDVCTHITDALRCTAETNTTLYYTPIEKKKDHKFRVGLLVHSNATSGPCGLGCLYILSKGDKRTLKISFRC